MKVWVFRPPDRKRQSEISRVMVSLRVINHPNRDLMQEYKLDNHFHHSGPIGIERPLVNPEVCVGGFLVENNRFLLGKRSKKKDWAAGLWDIIGGRSLRDEHPLLALQRETFEETGAQVRNAELIVSGDVVRSDSGLVLFHYHIFMITHFSGKVFNKTAEHSALQWFTRAELEELPLALREYVALIDDWKKKH